MITLQLSSYVSYRPMFLCVEKKQLLLSSYVYYFPMFLCVEKTITTLHLCFPFSYVSMCRKNNYYSPPKFPISILFLCVEKKNNDYSPPMFPISLCSYVLKKKTLTLPRMAAATLLPMFRQ